MNMEDSSTRPPLVSRFSSDGEESFMDRPEATGIMGVAKGIAELIVNDKNEVGNPGMGTEVEPGKGIVRRSKPPNLIRRITSKLRLATSPPLSPSLPSNMAGSSSGAQRDISQRGASVPHDSQITSFYGPGPYPLRDSPEQELDLAREREWFLATRSGVDQSNDVSRMVTDARKRKKGREIINSSTMDYVNVKTVQRAPIYPEKLASPLFGKSLSTPDLAKLYSQGAVVTPEDDTRGFVVQSRANISPQAIVPHPRNSSGQYHYRRRTNSSTMTSSPPSPNTRRRPKQFSRDLPPLPTEALYPQHASPALSSHSSLSSRVNSFIAADPFTPTSPAFSLASPITPMSPSRRRVSVDSSGRKSAEYIVQELGLPTRSMDIERTPVIVETPSEDDIPYRPESVAVHVENAIDAFKLDFPVVELAPPPPKPIRPKRPEFNPPTRPQTGSSKPSDMNTEDNFKGRTQRRKSFVGQSIENIRKSISRARPKSPIPPFDPSTVRIRSETTRTSMSSSFLL